MTIAILVFVLMMGAGVTWNFIPALGIQTPRAAGSVPSLPTLTVTTTSESRSGGGGPFQPSGANGSSRNQNSSSSSATSITPADVNVTRAQWDSYAEVAWSFFKPGVGVSPTTGLIYASPYWHEFTDWDLAGYIQSVLAAERLGLISSSGQWGADYRLGLVLNFLDTRTLTASGLWYQFYDADSGTVAQDALSDPGPIADGGPMLVALYATMQAHPEFTSQVKEAVGRVNYSSLVSDPTFASGAAAGDLYASYALTGFTLFGFKTPPATNLSELPNGSRAIAEPAMLAILEHVSTRYLNESGLQIYEAQRQAYLDTGRLFALSEGQYPPYLNSTTPYVYESIAVPSGTSYSIATWQGQTVNSSPENFAKIGFAFLAIYRSSYGLVLVNNFSKLATPDGYGEGVLQNGQVFNAVSDNTNIMIMEACAYGAAT